MSVSVRIAVQQSAAVKKLANGDAGRIIASATRRAGSSALRKMNTAARRRVRERKRIRLADIKRVIKVVRPSGLRMEWAIEVHEKPLPLTAYGPRQVRRGVSVGINRGKRSIVRGGFIARMPSGHRGVFVRRGSDRLPIDEQFGSRVVDAVSKPEDAVVINGVGEREFYASLRRLLDASL